MQNSIFHFSLICLDKNYDLGLKVAKKLLSILFKFSMISAQHLPMRAVFYRFYVVICRHCESIVVLKCCQFLEEKRLHRFIKLQLLNFQNFLPGKLLGSCLGFDLNLSLSPQQIGCNMYFWSFRGIFQVKMELENTRRKSAHNSFPMGMVRLAAT